MKNAGTHQKLLKEDCPSFFSVSSNLYTVYPCDFCQNDIYTNFSTMHPDYIWCIANYVLHLIPVNLLDAKLQSYLQSEA